MTPPAWSDVVNDLKAAQRQVERAEARHLALESRTGDDREAYELAIGKHLHDAYSATEKALERVIEMVDGNVPTGRSFHRDLIQRAAEPVEGVRPAIITPDSERAMLRLASFRHVFRHAYSFFDYEMAAPNVAIAAEAIPRLREEIMAFAAALGLHPRA